MIRFRPHASVFLLALPLTLAACSSSTERAAAPTEETATESATESAATLAGSSATYIDVENQIVLEDGTPVTVTWNVSDTDNKFWDGNSRPDHEPPAGLQGLVQTPSDGPYNLRLEVNSSYISGQGRFNLTPVATVDGERFPLQTLEFQSYLLFICDKAGSPNCKSGHNVPMWQAWVGESDTLACADRPMKKFTANTPRGQLTYGYYGSCNEKQPSQFIVTSLD